MKIRLDPQMKDVEINLKIHSAIKWERGRRRRKRKKRRKRRGGGRGGEREGKKKTEKEEMESFFGNMILNFIHISS